MALQCPDAGSPCHVPNLEGLVFRPRNGVPCIRCEVDGGHLAQMALIRSQEIASFDIPLQDHSVSMPSQSLCTRRIGSAAINVIRMPNPSNYF